MGANFHAKSLVDGHEASERFRQVRQFTIRFKEVLLHSVAEFLAAFSETVHRRAQRLLCFGLVEKCQQMRLVQQIRTSVAPRQGLAD